MERFEDLLLGNDNPLQNAALFGLIFDEPPTYEELLNGTVKLAPLFKLNEAYKQGKSIAVGIRGVEPRTFYLRALPKPVGGNGVEPFTFYLSDRRSTDELTTHKIFAIGDAQVR